MGIFNSLFRGNKMQNETRAMRLNQIAQTLRSLAAFGTTGGYDGADRLHDIYDDFGYPHQLEFAHFWNMYRRFGVARAVVDLLVDLTWVDAPDVTSENEQFNAEFKTLAKRTRLWSRLKGLDRRQRVGRYAGLFIQVKDGMKPSEPMKALPGPNAIVKLIPMYEGQLTVQETDTNPASENFGNPTMYQFNGTGVGGRNEFGAVSMSIHPSRLIIAAEGADDGSIYGISVLESIYNDLMDLRKISGAGGEGFYQNTRNAPVFKADDDYAGDEEEIAELETAIDEFLAKHRKRLVLRGIEPKFPNIQLSNPKDFYQAAINNISAGSNIPSAFLVGQQTGRLASDKDSRHLMTVAQSRRDNFLTQLVIDVVDWFIKYGALPDAEYNVEWGDLLTLSDDEKMEIVNKMATINEKQFRAGALPPFSEVEMREMAGYDAEPETIPFFDNPDETLQDEVPPNGDMSMDAPSIDTSGQNDENMDMTDEAKA